MVKIRLLYAACMLEAAVGENRGPGFAVSGAFSPLRLVSHLIHCIFGIKPAMATLPGSASPWASFIHLQGARLPSHCPLLADAVTAPSSSPQIWR